jgi:hypothetical protein
MIGHMDTRFGGFFLFGGDMHVVGLDSCCRRRNSGAHLHGLSALELQSESQTAKATRCASAGALHPHMARFF